ncbi:hypothetical protein VAE151_580092 [Vibrio aestuarianus]|uniref:Uncharacterized protein n=1 Tax=Vibrio aestuarianus TaxID=28171 RepID=A0ABM9FV78_9VIBR|nr:hypothetical protein VAE308_1080093 [Vibrio aestuarianus]CAH8217027.1 hypothetical protein VAE032_300093 [Vibrio aestuarianus]CAH8217154.1 hypothetical protein VAE128_480094 [Vibrio aestuarianus]CAH8217320.1 hypothetical protein VAE130_580216 [Vibrio aestuarianus]CAH8217570.1 hypothetical protein VAE115_350094 [Vibrio aestuarianus]
MGGNGGAMRDRTADLLRARQALSQLSYSPEFILLPKVSISVGGNGGSCRIRTCDQLIKSQLLYQLS